MAQDNGDRRTKIVALAKTRIGIPYQMDPLPDGVTTLDCSLFVIVTFRDAGLAFPSGVRTAEQIRQACNPIADWSTILPGDLLFFERTYDATESSGPDGHLATHVGISLGAGTHRMWDSHESTSPARPPGVGETDISTDYWQEHIFEARRPPLLMLDRVDPDPPVPPVVAGATYRTIASGVRLREGPGTDRAILIDDLGSNAALVGLPDLEPTADGHAWRHVRTADGRAGWVAVDLLQATDPNPALSNEPDHPFTFQELRSTINAAATRQGADPQILAAVIVQESSFTNWRVHVDGTGHGLIGLDDNGLLPDFEQWSGLSVGRGSAAVSIPPGLQIEYVAKVLAADTRTYGSALNAARVWHRGASLWQDAGGDFYAERITDHVRDLFG